jgi:hypothetical protein
MGFPVATRVTDELINAAIWNADVVGNMNNSIMHLLARKTGDEPIPSSTVLQNDDHLFFPVAANEVWLFHMPIWWTALTGFDMKWTFTWPAGATAIATTCWPIAGGTNPTIQQIIASGTASTLDAITSTLEMTAFNGMIANGATPGNMQFQFAQDTSNATPVVVKTNSTMWGVKLV